MKELTEFEKMRSRQLYDFSDPEIMASLSHAKEVCTKLQTMTITSDGYRGLIEDLIPGIPEDSTVCPPFHCDHGHGFQHAAFSSVGCHSVRKESGARQATA